MFKYLIVLSLVANLLALPSYAAEIAVAENLIFEIKLDEGWTLHSEPPEALVTEAATHVAHEPAAANASAAQIEKVTRKRMAVNEAFIYHAASGAHLDVDFSPLEQGSSAPSLRTLRSSAEFAAQSLEGEKGVSDLVWDVASATIDGVDDTFMLSADYLQHGQPKAFRGYIGYVKEYWFFLYFTAAGRSSEALQEMQSMLEFASIRLVKR
jgi:hypothetical protein